MDEATVSAVEWHKYERVCLKKIQFLWENEANERALFELDIINSHRSRQTAIVASGQCVLSLHCSLLVPELIRTVFCCSLKWSLCGQLIRRLVIYSIHTLLICSSVRTA